MVRDRNDTRATGGGSIGRELYRARVRRGLTLKEIADELNVPITQLMALEEEDFSVFSAEVYARGAYMKYAGYLGVMHDHSDRAILRALSAARQKVPLRLHTPQVWFERLLSPRLIFIAGVCTIALVVAGYIMWQVQSFWQLPVLEVVSPTSDIINDDQVEIRGQSEPQAHVRVNEEAVLLGEDASFGVILDLHPGINVVRIEAENAAGRKRVITRYLLRSQD